jgi:hypothetical protein
MLPGRAKRNVLNSRLTEAVLPPSFRRDIREEEREGGATGSFGVGARESADGAL